MRGFERSLVILLCLLTWDVRVHLALSGCIYPFILPCGQVALYCVNLQTLSTRPPDGLQNLIIFNSTFIDLSSFSHPDYRKLKHLEIGRSFVNEFPHEHIRHLKHLSNLLFFENDLGDIPPDAFKHLKTLTEMILASNKIHEIPDGVFKELSTLSFLSLYNNELTRITNKTFEGLNRLTRLDLSSNLLTPDGISTSAFAPLVDLQQLDLSSNFCDNLGHCNVSLNLKDLKNLEILAISAVSHELLVPTSLVEWSSCGSVEQKCKQKMLSNSSLDGFRGSNLQFVRMCNCPTVQMDVCTFCGIPTIKEVWMTNNVLLPANQAVAALYGLSNQQLDVVVLANVGANLSEIFMLGKKEIQILNSICPTYLILSNASMKNNESETIVTRNSRLAECVEELDLSQTWFSFNISTLANMFIGFKNAIKINLYSRARDRVLPEPSKLHAVNADIYATDSNRSPLLFHIPPSLSYLNLSGVALSTQHLPFDVKFISAENLRTLDMSWWGVLVCRTTYRGLPGLHTLDISGNLCLEISETMLDFLPSLKRLVFSHMVMKPNKFADVAGRLFKNVHHLEHLDLSHNGIVEVDTRSFRPLVNLITLNISHNDLSSLPVRPDFHEHLHTLDLSNNKFSNLSVHETHALESLASRHRVSVFIDRNPLECRCNNVEFLRWVLNLRHFESNITISEKGSFDAGRYLHCFRLDRSKTNVSDYSNTEEYRSCFKKKYPDTPLYSFSNHFSDKTSEQHTNKVNVKTEWPVILMLLMVFIFMGEFTRRQSSQRKGVVKKTEEPGSAAFDDGDCRTSDGRDDEPKQHNLDGEQSEGNCLVDKRLVRKWLKQFDPNHVESMAIRLGFGDRQMQLLREGFSGDDARYKKALIKYCMRHHANQILPIILTTSTSTRSLPALPPSFLHRRRHLNSTNSHGRSGHADSGPMHRDESPSTGHASTSSTSDGSSAAVPQASHQRTTAEAFPEGGMSRSSSSTDHEHFETPDSSPRLRRRRRRRDEQPEQRSRENEEGQSRQPGETRRDGAEEARRVEEHPRASRVPCRNTHQQIILGSHTFSFPTLSSLNSCDLFGGPVDRQSISSRSGNSSSNPDRREETAISPTLRSTPAHPNVDHVEIIENFAGSNTRDLLAGSDTGSNTHDFLARNDTGSNTQRDSISLQPAASRQASEHAWMEDSHDAQHARPSSPFHDTDRKQVAEQSGNTYNTPPHSCLFGEASLDVQVSSSCCHNSEEMLSEEAGPLGLVLNHPVQEQQQQQEDLAQLQNQLGLAELED